MPQIYDMGLYFPSEGRRRTSLNPQTWVLKASTLLLDHRSRLGSNITSKYLLCGSDCNEVIFKPTDFSRNIPRALICCTQSLRTLSRMLTVMQQGLSHEMLRWHFTEVIGELWNLMYWYKVDETVILNICMERNKNFKNCRCRRPSGRWEI